MRILITTQHLGVGGGVETHIRALLPLLRSAGHEVGVAYETPADMGQSTVLDHVSDVEAWQVNENNLRASVRSCERWMPDVAYNHGLVSTALESAIADRFTTLLFAHAYYGTCLSRTKRHSFPTAVLCERTFGCACLMYYFPRRCGGLNPLVALKLYRWAKQERHLLDQYAAILVASNHMHAEFRRNEILPERLHIVPLFPPDVTPLDEPPTPRSRTNRLLFVGRITEDKGWKHLLGAIVDAGKRLDRRLSLVVVGDGPDRKAMETAAQDSDLSVEFCGWLDRDGVTAEMWTADVMLMPSLWPEPFGLIGVEAGCVGLPTVGYASGGMTDWLIPGVSGESAPCQPMKRGQFADAITRALEQDSHLQRLRLGAWSIAKTFTPHAHLSRLTAILDSATNKKEPIAGYNPAG